MFGLAQAERLNADVCLVMTDTAMADMYDGVLYYLLLNIPFFTLIVPHRSTRAPLEDDKPSKPRG